MGKETGMAVDEDEDEDEDEEEEEEKRNEWWAEYK